MPMRIKAGTVSAPASKRVRVAPPVKLVGVSAFARSRAVTGSPVEVVEKDANFSRITGWTVTDYLVVPDAVGGAGLAGFTFTSSDPAIATVGQDGLVSYVAAGSATVSVHVNEQVMSVSLVFSESFGAQGTLTSWVAGSLAASASDAVDSRIAPAAAPAAAPAVSLPIYSTRDDAAGVYTKNASCWAADIDLSCVSVWNSSGANMMAGTAISPRHILYATHFPPSVGSLFRFVGTDGAVVTRTMTASAAMPTTSPYYPDFSVGLLDSALPSSVVPAKILPSAWRDYLPTVDFWIGIPGLCLDQEKKALVSDFSGGDGLVYFTQPVNLNAAQRALFFEGKIEGDSGSPAFLIVNNQAVLLTVWTFSGTNGGGTGSSLAYHAAAVNALMASLGGGYQLTDIDLSAFPTY
jgi:hypothetical protein